MEASSLVPHHELEGAPTAERPEAPGQRAVLTFGDVPAEYRAAQEGCCLFDATDRGRLDVRGADAASFLHRILSSDVRALAPGSAGPGLLLTSKGKVRFAFELEREEEGLRLSTPPGAVDELAAAVDTYLFTEDARLEDMTSEHAPLELCGPRTEAVLAAVLGPDSAPPGGRWHELPFQGATVRVTATAVAGSPGLRLDAGPEHVASLWAALVAAGAHPAGIVVRDMLRVEAGAALFGVDVDDEIYPQEARLERAFSLDKGCFIGQEVVAKIDTYGGLNKRLVALAIEGTDPLPRGARLLSEEDGEWRDLGLVTSWAYSFVLDSGLALGYVKRRHQAVGTRFSVGEPGGVAAEIVTLPVRSNALEVTGEVE